ncbi:SRPBCC family protein [Paenibacillus mendelii]|uniref:SRPBCC domain-containing protein n=1 Tax=Paenibacillus mendelii TaxID=206163 RepID=A0ABV6JEQ3_9BACL|nr:SRPBCC domain-containing protein [Paenibacillus mendelii]MCQ6557261.1 SRPBCC domain-containing protein [Paenibacillus mendelii]
MRKQVKITKNRDRRELVVERVMTASTKNVWQCWTKPAYLERWWGPRNWTATIYEMDVRPGGVWRYSLASNDGTGEVARCVATYNEVIEPARLVFTDTFADMNWNVVEGSDMHTTVTFEEADAGTRLTITTLFASVEDLENAEAMGMIEGFEDTLARLEDILSTTH